jgi:fatty-acyl-CoA synthase
VVGRRHELWGEVAVAFVALRPGCSATAEELTGHVRARLAHFKAPKDVVLVAELPKTSTGKIQKHVLRGQARPAG